MSDGVVVQEAVPALDAKQEAWLDETMRFFDQCPQGFAVAGPRAQLLATNAAFEAMLGYPRGGLLGRRISEFSHVDDVAREMVHFVPLLTGVSDTLKLDKRYIHREGHEVWATIWFRCLRAPDGALLRVIATIEQRDSMQARSEGMTATAELFSVVFEHAPVGLVLQTLDGRIARYNKAFGEMLGHTPHSLTHTSIFDTLHPDDVGLYRDKLIALQKSKHLAFEVRHRHRRGDHVQALVTAASVFDNLGVPCAVIQMVEDVTARRRTEASQRALEARAEHAQRVESLGHFAGSVAHDFNNLLTVIAANLELAQVDLPADASVQDSITQARLAATRATELTSQMLAYSGRAVTSPGAVDLGAAAAQNVRLLRAAIPRSCELILQVEAATPPAWVDPTQFQQVVMNLCLNAADALAGAPGRITVSTGARRVDRAILATCVIDDPLPEGTYAFVEVNDTGPGLAPEVLTRAFEPFFSTRGRSRGLGLATVLGIARSHKGAVCVTSELGHGARFTVYLPLAEQADAPAESTTAAERELVLVVDDEPAVARVLQRIVERASFSTRVVRDGVEAMGALQEGIRPVAIVCDVAMPRMGGIEFAQQARAFGVSAPIVFVSGYADTDVNAALKALEPACFLSKPVGVQALTEQLRAMVAAV